MTRPIRIWSTFAACLALGLAAMTTISVTALRAERAEAEALRVAALEEKVRLALWRMDSALAPLLAQEAARPYFHYAAFYPAERAYTRMFAEIQPGEVLIPSPLLRADLPHVLLHFQADARGRLSSPQVPAGNMRDLAESAYTTGDRIDAAGRRLGELGGRVTRDALLVQIPPHAAPLRPRLAHAKGAAPRRTASSTAGRSTAAAASPPPAPSPTPSPAPTPTPAPIPAAQRDEVLEQRTRNISEYQARKFQVEANQAQVPGGNFMREPTFPGVSPVQPPPASATPAGQAAVQATGPVTHPVAFVSEGPLAPVWLGDALILARRVWVGDREYVQGCWLDWPSLREWLLRSIADLLQGSQLVPTRPAETDDQGRLLAALPLRLVPRRPTGDGVAAASLVRVGLAAAWGGVLVAALAAGVLLRQALSLSERRGAFVSAVTHELRTPLTTFRLYSDLLAQGMVQDERERQSYLTTLRAEADRLDHLVKNVLAYARLEARRTPALRQADTVAGLLEGRLERLRQRTDQAGLSLAIEAPEAVRPLVLETDPAAVEQILFNLVDNACKYAVAGAQRVVRLEAAREGAWAVLRVRDTGPGIPAADRRRLFRPFSKSAGEAARSAPGVGLGLALSRRLARSLGGDLRLDTRGTAGACFELRLPLARQADPPRGASPSADE